MKSTARIALIGNMNNNFFSIARYLKDEGHEVDLFIMEHEPVHFYPEADSYSDDYKSYSKHINLNKFPSRFFSASRKEIGKLFNGYDFYFTCDAAPAYLKKIGKKSDIFIPYGSDLVILPFQRLKSLPILKKLKTIYLIRMQRRGIAEAKYIAMDIGSDMWEPSVKFLRPNGKRLVQPVPFIYTPQYESEDFEEYKSKSEFYLRFKKIREENELVIFHHSRHMWHVKDNLISPHSKDNDKLFRGFAQLLKRNPGLKASIILFEYGSSVEQSRELIRKLEIENHVEWFPCMTRKEIMIALSLADVGVGELNTSWLTYGTICEFMAMGVPVMHCRTDELYSKYYEELYPMYHAVTDEEVTAGLERILNNKEEAKEIGHKGKEWFQKYGVKKPIDNYLMVINNTLKNRS